MQRVVVTYLVVFVAKKVQSWDASKSPPFGMALLGAERTVLLWTVFAKREVGVTSLHAHPSIKRTLSYFGI